MRTFPWRSAILRSLLAISVFGFGLVIHAPTHLASALARLSGHTASIDQWKLDVPLFHTGFWLPPVGLVIALILRNRGQSSPTLRPKLDQRDLLFAVVLILVSSGIRLWPMLHDPWIKQDYDEGVYLGGAWLLHNGVLPYRDFVFPHLPGSLLLLQPAASLIQLWHDNTTALSVARGFVAISDSLAAGFIYLAARQIVRVPGALLSALVYTSDALAIQYSRGIRLEPLQAPWLIIGALLVLALLNGRRVGGLAGVCLAIGVSIKITGAVVPLAALVVCVIERRWQACRDLTVGLVLGGLGVCGWCLFLSHTEIVLQTVVLQLIRPAEPYRDRWGFLFGDQWSALTAMLAFCGVAGLAARLWHHHISSAWLFIWVWLALTLLLFAQAASFYPHYYTGLLAPAALLAAAVPNALQGLRRPWWGLGVSILLAPLAWGQMSLWPHVDRSPAQQPEIAALRALPPGKTVLTFIPLLSVLAGRPMLHVPGGPYLLDNFLGNPYLDSPLNRRWSTADATRAAAANAADYILGSRVDVGRIPGLLHSFTWQEVTPGSRILLFTRQDAPTEVMDVGPHLQLLQRPTARIEVVAGQREVVQPLYWRAPLTPPTDQALSLRLLNKAGERVAQVDVPLSGGITWQPNDITTLEYRIPIPTNVPPATYHVEIVAYSTQSQRPIAFQPLQGGAPVERLELPVVSASP